MLQKLLWLLFFPLVSSDSPVLCQSNNIACDAHDDNFIDSFRVETIEECRQLCQDSDMGCEFLTYYGENGFPLNHICELFQSCEKTIECNGCLSETKGCFEKCSNTVVGKIDENFMDYIPNLPTEADCINECKNAEGCNFYTFYLEDDPNYGACFLLSSLIEPLEECTSCVTGPLECENFDDCGFDLYNNGSRIQHMMLTEPGVEVDVNIRLSISKCQMSLLAVGGGGSGLNCGGGSGYIQYFTQALNSTPTNLRLAVGRASESSNVTINEVNKIEAEHGQDANQMDAGNGYSGGGGGYTMECIGGTDGGNGECNNGGKGTGEDVTTYAFKNFQLTPGAGSKYFEDGKWYRGGGGSGILVNDDGPGVFDMDDKAGIGFGGGGTFHNFSALDGRPGLILLEVVKG